jgi:hypothetical protein
LPPHQQNGIEHPSLLVQLISRANGASFSSFEYALKESSKPIGVGTYKVVSSVPDEFRDDLPAPEQIARLLSD